MRHTEAYKRRAISDTIKMCISPRCFKRELSRSRGAPPPPRPRNSSPAPISPNRSPCFISLFRFYPPEEIIIRPPLPLRLIRPADYHSAFYRFTNSSDISLERIDPSKRKIGFFFLLLLLFLPLLRIVSYPIAQVCEEAEPRCSPRAGSERKESER